MIAKINETQRLMFITHRTLKYTETEETKVVLEGGCKWIQVRMKEGLNPHTVREIIRLCHEYDPEVTICIDDDITMALACGASGVHLGKKDMPIKEARSLVMKKGRQHNFLIGATANTWDDICRAYDDGASYIGLGPLRHTGTKNNLSPLLGLDGYNNILRKCCDAGIGIPIFAIGGITSEDVKPLLSTGISGVAVSGAILHAPDPVVETQHFLQILHK